PPRSKPIPWSRPSSWSTPAPSPSDGKNRAWLSSAPDMWWRSTPMATKSKRPAAARADPRPAARYGGRMGQDDNHWCELGFAEPAVAFRGPTQTARSLTEGWMALHG